MCFMYAAIKACEDTLLIRRLQARELGYETDADRHTAIMQDILSLERGLRALKGCKADDGRQTTDDGPENKQSA